MTAPQQNPWANQPAPQQQGQPAAVAEQTFDMDDVFDRAGGGGIGAPSFKWPDELDPSDPQRRRYIPTIGGTIQGEIVDVYPTVVKDATTGVPKLIKSGQKMGQQQPQVNLTLQTSLRNWDGVNKIPLNDPSDPSKGFKDASEDTGLRRVYLKYRMLDATAAAIKASGQLSPKTGQPGGAPRVGAMWAGRLVELISTNSAHPLPDYQCFYKPAPAVTKADIAWEKDVEPNLQQPAAAPQTVSTVQQPAYAGAPPAAAPLAGPLQPTPQAQAAGVTGPPSAQPAAPAPAADQGDPWASRPGGDAQPPW